LRIGLLACALLLPAGTAQAAGSPFYVALGDSLAAGVQPQSDGASVATNQGYPSQLFHAVQAKLPSLRLLNLGCPGATTGSFMNGGSPCAALVPYTNAGARTSQYAFAQTFLRAHRKTLAFVTLDIGANNVDGCAAGGALDT